MLRSSIKTQLEQDYVRTARSRGSSRSKILIHHVLKNAMIPVITFLAVSAAEIMTGSIIIEQVFTIPGVSRLLLASISNRDFPVVQAIVVVMAAWIVIVNFVADLLYQLVDPRIRIS
jgi:ABC-type dipeptide/oligopeptide/nickel transport system permease component